MIRAGPRERELMRMALEASQHAHAPYSGYRVGSAVLTSTGNVYRGCNVENASYGLSMCAERTAIFSAVAAEGGAVRVETIAVACQGGEDACVPCGACRQVIAEFGTRTVIYFQQGGALRKTDIEALLPMGFRLTR